MPSTRRSFLQSGAALAAELAGPAAPLDALQGAPVQVPKMKFFHAEISRLVLGVNPFCGFAHHNLNFAITMKDWYTPDRVCSVMHQAPRYGISACNYAPYAPFPECWDRFQAERGQMN